MLKHLPLFKIASAVERTNYLLAQQSTLENPARLLPIIDKRFAALSDPQSLNADWDPTYAGPGLSPLAFQSSIGQIPMQFAQMLKETQALFNAEEAFDSILLLSKILKKCDEAMGKLAELKDHKLYTGEIDEHINRYQEQLTSLKTKFSTMLAAEENKITQAKDENIKPSIIIKIVGLTGKINKIISQEVPYTANDATQINKQSAEIMAKAKDVTGIDKQLEVLITKMAALNALQDSAKIDSPPPIKSGLSVQ